MFIGNELLSKLRKMRTLADDDDDVGTSGSPSKTQTSQQPAWMRNLHERCREWLSQLPLVRPFTCPTFGDIADLFIPVIAVRGYAAEADQR